MLCSRRSFSALGNEGLLHVHFGWTQRRRRDGWERVIYRRWTQDLMRDLFYVRLDGQRTVRLHRVSLAGQPLVRRRWLGRRGIQFDRGFRPSQRDVFSGVGRSLKSVCDQAKCEQC